MSRIILGGDPLYTLSPEEIVQRATRPGHQIFPGRGQMDYYRNRDLLKLYDGQDTLDIPGALKSYMHIAYKEYSERFNALRLGELLNWGVQHGIVERVYGRAQWTLVEREQQFELCGPERKQLAVRVRGLSGIEAVVGAKLWQRELKRRERARVKRVTALFTPADVKVKFIVRHTPDVVLEGVLERFTVGDMRTMGECHELLLESFMSLETTEAQSVTAALTQLYTVAVELERETRHADELEGLEL
ncbi:hypothetical protein [Pelagibacterium luteolum]|uniref:Uncharacterized protein n=1 Tax=Pelagibacterium luteolum TaxID=440168 RepID=A0A1G7XIG5_9HYPH|nr:hypothetical protein [Pelagibacterium luteolum]SDG83906.1 hypothetical protein SAMN04487974_109134 [Pelagibacterium luteolum]